MKKLRNNQGETLVEVLASILIGTLSVTLLFSCIMAASRMDTDAQKLDQAHYDAFSKADGRSEPITVPDGQPTPHVTITGKTASGAGSTATPPIVIYGDTDGGMYSYKEK